MKWYNREISEFVVVRSKYEHINMYSNPMWKSHDILYLFIYFLFVCVCVYGDAGEGFHKGKEKSGRKFAIDYLS